MESSRKRSNSKTTTKIYLTWDSYNTYIDDLCSQIKSSKKKFDYIYGIPRGGMILAGILAHKLGIEKNKISPSLTDILFDDDLNCLIIDDIIDTGETFDSIINAYTANFYFATLFKHKKCKMEPDFYVKENDQWIVFPYEKG